MRRRSACWWLLCARFDGGYAGNCAAAGTGRASVRRLWLVRSKFEIERITAPWRGQGAVDVFTVQLAGKGERVGHVIHTAENELRGDGVALDAALEDERAFGGGEHDGAAASGKGCVARGVARAGDGTLRAGIDGCGLDAGAGCHGDSKEHKGAHGE